MDRTLLKEKAKNSIAARRIEAIAVAFIMGMCEAGSIGFNFFGKGNANGQSYDFDIGIEPVLTGILTVVFVLGLIFTLAKYFIFSVLETGGCRFFLKSSKNERTGVGEITGNFRDGNYLNITITMFVKDFCTGLWTLLFIIPGIYKAFEYAMIPYVLAVRPNIDRKEAFKLSKTLMDGHKLDYFVLLFSFLGWQILSLFTFGLLSLLYVNPYMQAAKAEFFYEVRNDAILRGDLTDFMLPSYGAANNGFNGNSTFNNGFNGNSTFNGGFANSNPNNNNFNNNNFGGFNNNNNYGNFGQSDNQAQSSGYKPYEPDFTVPDEPDYYGNSFGQDNNSAETNNNENNGNNYTPPTSF